MSQVGFYNIITYLVYGMSLDSELGKIRNSLGLCTQKDCLYDYLSVEEHLQFIGALKGAALTRQEIDRVLQQAELETERNKLVKALSGGSKRKLSLAMSLVGDSKIIFLDEPTSGMDAFSRRSIWAILERVKQEKRTIILTTHHLDEAEVLADRIGIMSRGQLLAVGTSDFIKRKFGEGYSLKLTGDTLTEEKRTMLLSWALELIPDVLVEQNSNSLLSLLVPFRHQNRLSAFFRKVEESKLAQIGLKVNTLEDAFVKIGMEEEKFFQHHHDEQLLSEEKREDKKELELSYQEKEAKSSAHCEPKEIPVPNCLSQPPSYSFLNQLTSLFLRRLLTTIRTNTNYIAFVIPLITIFLGLVVVTYMEFPGKLSEPIIENYMKLVLLACIVVIAFCFNSTIYITLPVQERELLLKKVLHGMGLRVAPYWLGTFCFDIIVYTILVIFYFIIARCFDLEIVTHNFWQTLLIFVTFGLTYLVYAYLCGFIFKTVDRALKLFAIFNFFVVFCIPFMINTMATLVYTKSNENEVIKYGIYVLQVLFMIFSPFWNFYEGYSLINVSYKEIQKQFPSNAGPLILQKYWAYAYVMLYQAFVFGVIIYVLENFHSWKKRKSIQSDQLPIDNLEANVREEYQSVLGKQQKFVIRAELLKKRYSKKGKDVLMDTTFGVERGKILGIIGPNGAGKSTILNILTGITRATGGAAEIYETDVLDGEMQIAEHVGVCCQFDCIWENLTPVEHLRLFGRMKGLNGAALEEAVEYFISTMQLGLFVKTQSGRLSGGNKRKLCVAIALIGGSDITFFDEPSTGVDPISRRFLFNTLKRNVQLRNCSAIMTTHTIEEAEQLSDKLGYVLVENQFLEASQSWASSCASGLQSFSGSMKRKSLFLRKYGDGYQIQVKLKEGTQQECGLSSEISNRFEGSQQLEDKRHLYLTFAVPSIGFSFFKTFEFFDQKISEEIVEEFSIIESSLEQVFIHFSKLQQEKNKQEGLQFD